MLDLFSAILWDVDPVIFSVGPITLRWYGLLFASGFIIGQYIMADVFKKEGKPEKDLDALLMYMIVGTVLGARLGHCLFYQPDYYLANPLEILMVWEGGLASHGATIGILTAVWLYVRKRPDQPYLWILDRIVIAVALGGAFIRLGNLMNSEIIGLPTDMPWGFVFPRAGGFYPEQLTMPRHPAQLYEALSCLLLFGLLYLVYLRRRATLPHGSLLGAFMVVLFALRIFYEYFKEDQVAFEADMSLNMGQWLSIPAVLIGLGILLRALYQGKPTAQPPADPTIR